MKAALLVIDLQRYYLEVGSSDKLAQVDTLIAKTNELIGFFHRQTLPVFRLELAHKPDGSTWNQAMKPHWSGQPLPGTMIEGTWEVEPHPSLIRSPADVVVRKTRGSAFLRTDLESRLLTQGIDTIVLAGYSTNRCVGLTAIDAWERDFQVILASEAILGTNATDSSLMLGYLKKAFEIEPRSNQEIIQALETGQVIDKTNSQNG